VFQPLRDHPNVGGIREREPGDHPERHHAPEQELAWRHRAHVAPHHERAHDSGHGGHHRVHTDELWQECLADILPVRAAHHPLHEQRLEDQETEEEPGHVFHDPVDPHRQPERRRDDRGQDDASRVASDAVDGAANALLPQRPDEFLVGPRVGFLIRQDVQEQTEGAHVEGRGDETPLHDIGFGIIPELVPRHVRGGECGENEPPEQKIVDRLDQHSLVSVVERGERSRRDPYVSSTGRAPAASCS
jgi:hypothetical protein